MTSGLGSVHDVGIRTGFFHSWREGVWSVMMMIIAVDLMGVMNRPGVVQGSSNNTPISVDDRRGKGSPTTK